MRTYFLINFWISLMVLIWQVGSISAGKYPKTETTSVAQAFAREILRIGFMALWAFFLWAH